MRHTRTRLRFVALLLDLLRDEEAKALMLKMMLVADAEDNRMPTG